MQMELDGLSESALRRIYTLCQLSLARRDEFSTLQLPTGYFMVGVDIPAGAYSASSPGMCVIGAYDYVLMGGEPTPVTLKDGQVIQAPLSGGVSPSRPNSACFIRKPRRASRPSGPFYAGQRGKTHLLTHFA